LAKHVNELVGRINGVYGTLEYSPIHYINQSIPQDELIAIYHLADACLVTSVRDGMNLVSHEYVAAQESLDQEDSIIEETRPRSRASSSKDDDDVLQPFVKEGPGALVLSEFAGSAQSLSGAIRVNPWNTDELARAIHDALTLTRVERELRWAKLHRYVSTNTASYWARSFVDEFRDVCEHPPLLPKLPKLPAGRVLQAYQRASRRLVVTDYDGTLTQMQSLPRLATPAPVVTQLLATLSRDPRNTVYVVSGRERRFMEKWLGRLKVGLAAEFGFCHRAPGSEEWTSLGRDLDTSWKDVVRPIMQYFAERTPGTYIESKESSLAWHYRDADPHFGAWQAKDMQIHMEDVMSTLPLEIIQGNRLVEVRHVGVNKSLVLEEVLRQGPRNGYDPPPPSRSEDSPAAEVPTEDFDFVLCVGDDRSDEDMYQLLKSWHSRRCEAIDHEDDRAPDLYNVHIGPGATHAEFCLESVVELRKILRGMAATSLKDSRTRRR
jgi:trehalose 6-phosphate synthase/phosphatase